MKKLVLLVLVLGAAGGGGYWWFFVRGAGRSSEVKFRTVKVEKGDVVEGVNATGTVQPLMNVQVGTQVTGVIERLFKDFNDKVKAGEVIALIDSRRYAAVVAQDEASLGRSVADVARVRAQLTLAEKDLRRARTLHERKLVSDAELDAATANEGALRAQLALSESVVTLSRAALEQDLVNLRFCTIAAPTDGVVVSRNVDVGQTVQASLQAPTLFVIANDLTKVQVQASVPEADIGRIREKQRVTFTVDAHPDHTFEGRVSQVRLASTTVQNVVTYTVIVDAANPESLLLPGMTANVTFEIARSKKDALHVMTTALRYQPPTELLEPEAREAPGEKKERRGEGAKGEGAAKAVVERPARENGKEGSREGGRRGGKGGRVFVKNDRNQLHPVPVKVGVSDGAKAEIEARLEKDAELLVEGAVVVIGVQAEEEEAAKNPFAPQMGGGGRRGMR